MRNEDKYNKCKDSEESFIECIPETNPFSIFWTVTFSAKNKGKLEDLKRLGEIESKVQQVRLQEKSHKKIDFQFDEKELFEPNTNVVTETSKKTLKYLRPQLKQLKGILEIYLEKLML